MENFALVGIFLLLGMIFQRLPSFPRDTPQVLNIFVIYVSLPALILLNVPRIRFGGQADLVPLLVPWGMLICSIPLVLLAGHLWRWPRTVVGALLLLAPMGNTSFLGIPMVQAFFGNAGLPYLVVYDQLGTLLIFSTYGALILALYGEGGRIDLPSVARRMLLFPPTIALLLGFALRSWPYPPQLEHSLQLVSHSLVPLAMTAVGYQIQPRPHRHTLGPVACGLTIKLLLAPLLALAACRLAGLQGLAVEVSVIEAGMPPMVTGAALAVVAGLEAELSVALVGMGIVLSFATLPLLYWLMRLL